jgi:PAS domain S-box-containing protein
VTRLSSAAEGAVLVMSPHMVKFSLHAVPSENEETEMDSLICNDGQVFDSLPLPATLVDVRGMVADVNQAFLALALSHGQELRKEDRIGGHIASFARTEEERSKIKAFIEEVLRTGKDQHILWSGEDKNGNRRYWDIHASVLKEAAGEVIGAIVLREDVTERRNRELRISALQKVRDEIWKMETSGEVHQIIAAVRGNLLELGLSFSDLGVNLIDAKGAQTTGIRTVLHHQSGNRNGAGFGHGLWDGRALGGEDRRAKRSG